MMWNRCRDKHCKNQQITTISLNKSCIYLIDDFIIFFILDTVQAYSGGLSRQVEIETSNTLSKTLTDFKGGSLYGRVVGLVSGGLRNYSWSLELVRSDHSPLFQCHRKAGHVKAVTRGTILDLCDGRDWQLRWLSELVDLRGFYDALCLRCLSAIGLYPGG